MPAGVKEEKGDCFGVPDLMRLQCLKGIIGWEDHSVWMTIEGDADQNYKRDAENDECLLFCELEKACGKQ